VIAGTSARGHGEAKIYRHGARGQDEGDWGEQKGKYKGNADLPRRQSPSLAECEAGRDRPHMEGRFEENAKSSRRKKKGEHIE